MAIPVPICSDGPNELLRKILLGLADLDIGGGSIEVDDEGVPLTLALESLNFVGGGVTATVVGNDVTVTIPGSSFIIVQDEGVQITPAVAQFNFVGAGVTATAVGNNVTVTVPGGPGDVVGPASAVDDRIATFDGATGKLIQDSGVLISSVVTNTTLQAGSQAIGSGVDTISVVFPTPFAAAPVVVANMSRPVAESLLTVNIDKASITTLGFTASLGSTTDSANYFLEWIAK